MWRNFNKWLSLFSATLYIYDFIIWAYLYELYSRPGIAFHVAAYASKLIATQMCIKLASSGNNSLTALRRRPTEKLNHGKYTTIDDIVICYKYTVSE